MHDFAVFILSHGRPSKVITATTLKRQGYTGSIFIVVDNEDRHIDDYRKIYGDSVVVFDKKMAICRQIYHEGQCLEFRQIIFVTFSILQKDEMHEHCDSPGWRLHIWRRMPIVKQL